VDPLIENFILVIWSKILKRFKTKYDWRRGFKTDSPGPAHSGPKNIF